MSMRALESPRIRGAPVLGFDHAVIKAHGRSDAHAIENAIRVARKTVERDLIARVRQGLADEESVLNRRPDV